MTPIERAFELSHQTGISLLEIPTNWHVSVPVYIAALEGGEGGRLCASMLQRAVEHELASGDYADDGAFVDPSAAMAAAHAA